VPWQSFSGRRGNLLFRGVQDQFDPAMNSFNGWACLDFKKKIATSRESVSANRQVLCALSSQSG